MRLRKNKIKKAIYRLSCDWTVKHYSRNNLYGMLTLINYLFLFLKLIDHLMAGLEGITQSSGHNYMRIK